MRGLRFLGLVFGRCAHDEMIRERDAAAVYWLRCSGCGYRVEALQRSPDERDAQRAQFPLPVPSVARVVKPARARGQRRRAAANVVQMPVRKAGQR